MLLIKPLLWVRFHDIQNNQGWGRGYQSKAMPDNPQPRLWLFWISQKPNLILVVLLLHRTKMRKSSLFLHWWQAIQSTWTWHDYPEKSCTTWPDYTNELESPLTWLLYNLQRDLITHLRCWFLNIYCKLSANQKRDRLVSSMSNKFIMLSVILLNPLIMSVVMVSWQV